MTTKKIATVRNRRPQPLQHQLQTDFSLPGQMRGVPRGDMPLRLACVIPCFNEALVLRDTLASVLAAGLSPDDVLVIDDCSTDETGRIAEGVGVRVLRNT